jgi:hypothetical protein
MGSGWGWIGRGGPGRLEKRSPKLATFRLLCTCGSGVGVGALSLTGQKMQKIPIKFSLVFEYWSSDFHPTFRHEVLTN